MHSLKFALSSFAGISLIHRVGKLEGLDHTRSVVDYTRSDSDLFVRLDPGEEIHAALKILADDLGFDAAAITSGIGRTRGNLYGFMDEDGVYQRRMLDQPSELVSLSGNVARSNLERRSPTYTVVGRMMTIMFMPDICFNRQCMLLQKSTLE